MKLFSPLNINYLYDLACEFGEITISVDFMLEMVINPDEHNRGTSVRILYDGGPIAKYEFTSTGVAQALSMLKLAQKKSNEDLRQMRTQWRIDTYGESTS